MHIERTRTVNLQPSREGDGKAGMKLDQQSFWAICLGAGSPLEGPEILLKYSMVQNCVIMMVVMREPEKVKSSSVKHAGRAGICHSDQKSCSKEVNECRLENILSWDDSSPAEAHTDITERW